MCANDDVWHKGCAIICQSIEAVVGGFHSGRLLGVKAMLIRGRNLNAFRTTEFMSRSANKVCEPRANVAYVR